jgi:hypothetical protein
LLHLFARSFVGIASYNLHARDQLPCRVACNSKICKISHCTDLRPDKLATDLALDGVRFSSLADSDAEPNRGISVAVGY